MNQIELARFFDHTLLKPTAMAEDIQKLCTEAREYQFATVCVNPCWVTDAATWLQGSSVGICTVVGFPLGANTTAIKIQEAVQAITQGATEIDMVMNVGWALAGNWSLVTQDIRQVCQAIAPVPLKVILETCYLSSEQLVLACQAATQAQAQFVKTSTGFGPQGAALEQVRLMKKSIATTMQVKASGGIRSLKETLGFLEAGAQRIGASASVAILKEFRGEVHAGDRTGY